MGVVLKSQLPTNSHPKHRTRKMTLSLGPWPWEIRLFSKAQQPGFRNEFRFKSEGGMAKYWGEGWCMTGWRLNQPIWKIWSSNWKSSPSFGVKIKNYRKPPPRWCIYWDFCWDVSFTGIFWEGYRVHTQKISFHTNSLNSGRIPLIWCQNHQQDARLLRATSLLCEGKKKGLSWKVYHSSPKNWRSNDNYCNQFKKKVWVNHLFTHFYHHHHRQSPPPQVATNLLYLLSFTTMTISYLKSAQKKVKFSPGPHAVARRGCQFLGPAGGVITNSSPLEMMGFQQESPFPGVYF